MSREADTSHPPTSVMVNKALEVLHNRRGISFYSIKQYVFSTYADVDPVRYTPLIKKCLENAITKGEIVRTRGIGMVASFKLASVTGKVKKTSETAGADGKKSKPMAKKPKKTEPTSASAANKKIQKKPTSAANKKIQKPVDQKVKKKKISITATKVRKGKVAK
mgnify:CR=1 FL=1